MKNRKTSLAFVLLALGSMSMVACGNKGNNEVVEGQIEVTCENCIKKVKVAKDTYKCPECKKGLKKCPPHTWSDFKVTEEPTELKKGKKVATCYYCDKQKTEEIEALGFLYNVVFKGADGSEIKSEQVRSVNKIEKPADPAAPAGQVFYGWKNVKNGGQIWNFDDDTLAKPHADVELVPCFVPANMTAQYLEAEFVPDITANGGMDGATYSGGAKGKQFIRADEEREYGSTCEVEPFKYYKDPSSRNPVIATAETAPEGVTLLDMDPKGSNCGYFVHFNYKNGNTFTFNITCDAAVDNAVIFASFSAEYGLINDQTSDRYCTFSDTTYPISVNGTPLQYGSVTMHAIPEIGDFLPFQDYFLGANVSLNAGENVITMVVNNEDSLNGTIASTAPCVDSLKIFTSANISWPSAELTNIIK